MACGPHADISYVLRVSFNSNWPWENKLWENFNCNLALGGFFCFLFSFKFKLDKVKMFMPHIVIASGNLEITINANHFNNW